MKDKIFEAYQLKDIILKNRIVMAPLVQEPRIKGTFLLKNYKENTMLKELPLD